MKIDIKLKYEDGTVAGLRLSSINVKGHSVLTDLDADAFNSLRETVQLMKYKGKIPIDRTYIIQG